MHTLEEMVVAGGEPLPPGFPTKCQVLSKYDSLKKAQRSATRVTEGEMVDGGHR